MASSSIHVALNLLSFLLLNTIHTALSSQCITTEREALLDLKSNLQDPDDRLSSWVRGDCCSWAGVGCDGRTGHVVRLDLRRPESNNSMPLVGALSPSILGLQHLRYLDLSWNDFQGAPLPEFIGSLKDLSYLNFSGAGFSGIVPRQLGNLAALQHLDLSGNYLSDDTDGNARWLRALAALDSLSVVSLAGSGLSNIPISLPNAYFKSLSFLDLSSNSFNCTIPEWLFNITSLKHLDLSANVFQGPIPSSIGSMTSLSLLDLSSSISTGAEVPRELGNLCNLKSLYLSYLNLSIELIGLHEVFSGCVRNSLEILDLSASQLSGCLPDWLGGIKNLRLVRLFGNSIYGSLPDSLGNLKALQSLDIGSNQLNGTISENIGQLSNLTSLVLQGNSLKGVISEAHFADLRRLKRLDWSSNSLALNVASDWIPPFQLEYIDMSSCQIGPRFPQWLQMQANISYLDLSNVQISDAMPEWFWSLTSRLNYLDLSNNQISGRVPKSLALGDGDFLQVDLSSNCFVGPVPKFPSNVAELDLSNNSFSGPVPASIGDMMQTLVSLSLSMNKLSGGIPSSLCKLVELRYLDLSNNNLSGELPNCWNESSLLEGLDFSNNNISGGIPSTICSLPSLQTLHLSNNGLTGEFPKSLKSCQQLVTLDLHNNWLEGEIPTWLGESSSNLKILSLRSNNFVGNIPSQLSQLAFLQILDLSHNNLSGVIPRSFGNFSAMRAVRNSMAPIIPRFINYNDYMHLFIKGRELQYKGLLSLLTLIDLSDNKVSGNIPMELSYLTGLWSLNLSMNHLTGEITGKIGELGQLESLDLSRNELSGAIPLSMDMLTSLSELNLSYNLLSGRIPSGHQLQTLADPTIYAGNLDLCGFPLSKNCGSEGALPLTISAGSGGDGGKEEVWIFAGMMPGFVVGIGVVFYVLLSKKTWKDSYFQMVDNMYDSLHTVITKRMSSHNEY